jgi:hypothetical protein
MRANNSRQGRKELVRMMSSPSRHRIGGKRQHDCIDYRIFIGGGRNSYCL